MAEYRTPESYFDELIRHPQDARLFAESEIAIAVTRMFTRLRKAAGLSQRDLAERIGRKQPYVAKLEAGAYDRCSLPTLRTFARALGHDIDVGAMLRPLPQIAASDIGNKAPADGALRCDDDLPVLRYVRDLVAEAVRRGGGDSMAVAATVEPKAAAVAA